MICREHPTFLMKRGAVVPPVTISYRKVVERQGVAGFDDATKTEKKKIHPLIIKKGRRRKLYSLS